MTPPDQPDTSQADEERTGVLAWVNRHKVPLLASSAAVSLLVHVVILLIAALIRMNQPVAQLGSASPEVEFAVMTDAELAEIAAEELALEAPDTDASSSALEMQAELDLGALEVDMSDLAESMGDVSLQLGGGDLEGVGLGGGDSVGAGASFFGVEARGNNFAFVVDTSGSMVNDGRLQSLQQELIRSITGLFSSSNFFVAFFNSGARPLGDRGVVWAEATDSGKNWARAHVLATRAEGATRPAAGFELVAMLEPRPDAIYFMTDGEFSDDEAEQILSMFERVNIPIHCITFRSREGEALMRRIATSTRGTYTHIEGPR
ncbi:MAG: vWA domain-containing protein [Phycisphaerales bacterium]